jgi:predicted ABC-type ATPase
MSRAILIAGPNGAGKTTFANEYLSTAEQTIAYVNADELARDASLSELPAPQRDIKAGRLMLRSIGTLADSGADFMFETTLSSLAYAHSIRSWQGLGYTVALIYLRLPSVEQSIARVRRRVAAGGHDIPESIIRRRYDRSLQNLEQVYRPIVDEWYIWDSLEGDFKLAQSWENR